MAIGRAGPGWEGRAGLGRASNGSGQNRVDPKLIRFFWIKILTAQSALKTGLIGPNSIFKVKKTDGSGRAGSNLARFFSGQ